MEVIVLANIKGAKKRILTSAKRAERNKSVRSEVRTSVKKVDAAIASGNKDDAKQALQNLQSVMGKATSKGVYKKNNNARKISRMSAKVDAME